MAFYTSIQHYYDFIFPLNTKQIEFTLSEIPFGSKLLDIGCATGNLAIALAEQGYAVKAFDLDQSMIEAASNKIQNENPSFRVGNMLNIQVDYSTEVFDGILCFGNTLVHLSNASLVEEFFESVHFKLKKGGKFLFQILNYQYILDSKPASLPLIDNEHITFIREYDYLKNGLINFKTKLHIKETNIEVKNEVELLPLTKTEILDMLQKTGFKNIEFYGSFAKTGLEPTSITLVVKAEK